MIVSDICHLSCSPLQNFRIRPSTWGWNRKPYNLGGAFLNFLIIDFSGYTHVEYVIFSFLSLCFGTIWNSGQHYHHTIELTCYIDRAYYVTHTTYIFKWCFTQVWLSLGWTTLWSKAHPFPVVEICSYASSPNGQCWAHVYLGPFSSLCTQVTWSHRSWETIPSADLLPLCNYNKYSLLHEFIYSFNTY